MKLWKRTLALFFLLVVFDGALRKWVAPGLSTVLLLLKDGVLIVALGLYASEHRLRLPQVLRKTWLPLLLGAYAVLVLVRACSFSIPTLAVSVLGVKSHLLYMVLLILVPAVLADMDDPLRFMGRLLLFLFVPILVLGIYQYFQSPAHWINTYVGDTDEVTAIAGHARITGTFSYIAGMTKFIQFVMFLGFGLLVAGWGRSRRLQWIGGGGVVLALTVAPMTGSRSVLFLPLLPLPIVLYQLSKRSAVRKQVFAGLVLVAFGVLALAQTQLVQGWETFAYRVDKAGDTQKRIRGGLGGPMEEIEAAGLFGYGPGTAHQAASRIVPPGTPKWLPPVSVEGERERLTMEIGLVGLLLYMAIKTWVVLLAYRVLARAREPFALTVGIVAFMSTFVSWGLGGLVYRTTDSALYWLLVGTTVFVWSRQKARRRAERALQSRRA